MGVVNVLTFKLQYLINSGVGRKRYDDLNVDTHIHCEIQKMQTLACQISVNVISVCLWEFVVGIKVENR